MNGLQVKVINMDHIIFKKVVFISMILVFNCVANAGVNLKNGNFYISYTDLSVPGEFSIEITRTYNSKASKRGWFGFGWGSGYETFLTVTLDGRVVIHENGSGAETIFNPEKQDQTKISDSINRIVNKVKEFESLSKEESAHLKERLKDSETRNRYVSKYFSQDEIIPLVFEKYPVNLFSNSRGYQTLTITKDSFIRRLGDGREETFDKFGRLIKITNHIQQSIKIVYEKEPIKLTEISSSDRIDIIDHKNNKVSLYRKTINGRRFVKQIGWENHKVFYNYSESGDLVFSKDVLGNSYRYLYDKYHNLIQIGYSDETSRVIGYSAHTQWVSYIKNRDNSTEEYKYWEFENAPKFHYATEVFKKSFGGETIRNYYEYEIGIKKPTGDQWTKRIVTIINGFRTETTYNSCCSLPVKIVRGDQMTTFKYDEKKGLLTEKSSPQEITCLEYHPILNKITFVLKVRKDSTEVPKGTFGCENIDNMKRNDAAIWSNFIYDSNGNLKTANNSENDTVTLKYGKGNDKGRVVSMESPGHKLVFEYNEFGKPKKITIIKPQNERGELIMSYNDSGQIVKVEGSGNDKTADNIKMAFQHLLSIVEPAGVSLGF